MQQHKQKSPKKHEKPGIKKESLVQIKVIIIQWFSKWSISTPRGQLNHPRGR